MSVPLASQFGKAMVVSIASNVSFGGERLLFGMPRFHVSQRTLWSKPQLASGHSRDALLFSTSALQLALPQRKKHHNVERY